jgi:sec-independent protein translocase protein TatB
MIELSLGKMVLLALIALIVLGPEKLPGAARTAGALLRRVRSGWDNVRAEVERELEIEELKRHAREAVASAEAAQQHVKNTLKETHDPFAEAAAMVKLQPPSSNAPPKPDDMTTEARLANGPLPTPSTPAGESPLDASDHAHTADDSAADQPFEGVQAELPLDAPRATAQRELPLDRDASHDHA